MKTYNWPSIMDVINFWDKSYPKKKKFKPLATKRHRALMHCPQLNWKTINHTVTNWDFGAHQNLFSIRKIEYQKWVIKFSWTPCKPNDIGLCTYMLIQRWHQTQPTAEIEEAYVYAALDVSREDISQLLSW